MKYKDFCISFNEGDSDLEYGHLEEIKDLEKKLLSEFNTLSNQNSKQAPTLNANQVMNKVYNVNIVLSVLPK